jgi:hypothetical protein
VRLGLSISCRKIHTKSYIDIAINLFESSTTCLAAGPPALIYSVLFIGWQGTTFYKWRPQSGWASSKMKATASGNPPLRRCLQAIHPFYLKNSTSDVRLQTPRLWPAQTMNQTQAAKKPNPQLPRHRNQLVVPPGLMIQLNL